MSANQLNTQYKIQIAKQRSNRLSLSVSPDGSVVVTKPRLMPDFMVKGFVEKHQDWIIKQQAKRQRQKPLMTNEMVLIFGQKYERVSSVENSLPTGINIVNQQAIYQPVVTVTQLTAAQLQKKADLALNAFLKRAATSYILPRTAQLAEKMQITYRSISLKQQKSRWGSCSSQARLNFNWRLTHFAPEIIDYVIIHELAHRVHMDHSRDFWRLVAKFDPEYQKHKKSLKQAALVID